ncbi:MAG: Type 1 glutamine amidotransferase-like domain-containing protein [Acidobacteria bacterium]|nr:Type 1 glutamine amidotransferase-like domain-containing protein [Acidobacteriota bacterium]
MTLLFAAAALGTLFLDGGSNSAEIGAAFGRLANGRILLIPTALSDKALNEINLHAMPVTGPKYFGVDRVIVLHAPTRYEANREDFVEPLRANNAVFFMGGDHQRLLDRYAGTRFETELKALYERGDVIGGSSAGAMVRGAYQAIRPDGDANRAGFALLANTLIDLHFTERHRQRPIPPILRLAPVTPQSTRANRFVS